MSLFRGSGVAIVTPMHNDGQVHLEKLAELIDFQMENQTDALIICGTTGEASTLTDEEQVECVRFAAEHVKKRVPVIAGAGSNDTPHAVALAKSCEKAGADGVLLVTPYYNKTTQKGLIRHYTTIAESLDVPIILYNVPSRTGLSIDPKTCYALSKVPNIVGIKEASGNFSNIAEIASLCGPDFGLYSGNDDQILPVLSLGGIGVISVLANIAPRQTHDMVMKFLEGDITGAAALQCQAIPLIQALFCEVNPIPVKTALNLMGYAAGPCKPPLYEMEEAHLAQLKEAMASYGLLKANA